MKNPKILASALACLIACGAVTVTSASALTPSKDLLYAISHNEVDGDNDNPEGTTATTVATEPTDAPTTDTTEITEAPATDTTEITDTTEATSTEPTETTAATVATEATEAPVTTVVTTTVPTSTTSVIVTEKTEENTDKKTEPSSDNKPSENSETNETDADAKVTEDAKTKTTTALPKANIKKEYATEKAKAQSAEIKRAGNEESEESTLTGDTITGVIGVGSAAALIAGVSVLTKRKKK